MRLGKISAIFLLISVILLAAFSGSASAVYLANSKDWKDVYSVMLYAALQNEKGVFLNSESIASVAKLLPADQHIDVFESISSPMIANVEGQFSSAGYDVATREKADNLNVVLAPTGKAYFLIAEENFKISVPLASLAATKGAWVFILNENNVDQIVAKLQGATSVTAVGNFRRDILTKITPLVTETINNNNVYTDSQDIAKKFDNLDNVILSDGTVIESEFFSTKNAVLLTGPNKILDDTYNFLVANNVKSIVLVGNKLSVVGEQIRTRSEKKISVFVKFGYGNTAEGEKVYALSMFPLPQPTLGLTVTRVAYDPQTKVLRAFFKNFGSGGVYELSTLSVKDENNREIAAVSDKEVVFLGAGEAMPISYPAVDIPLERVNANTSVEFFTSYGLEPGELDSFLTMQNAYGPPFRIGLELETQANDNLVLNITDVAYYTNLKRVGVTLENPSEKTIFYSIKIQNIIINGISQNLYAEGDIAPGNTKIAYMPASLDQVDLEENKVFDITVLYGGSSDLKIHIYRPSPLPEFQVRAGGGGLTGFIAGISSTATSPIGLIVIVTLIVGMLVAVVISRRRKN